jgi:hypothetical protein
MHLASHIVAYKRFRVGTAGNQIRWVPALPASLTIPTRAAKAVVTERCFTVACDESPSDSGRLGRLQVHIGIDEMDECPCNNR